MYYSLTVRFFTRTCDSFTCFSNLSVVHPPIVHIRAMFREINICGGVRAPPLGRLSIILPAAQLISFVLLLKRFAPKLPSIKE